MTVIMVTHEHVLAEKYAGRMLHLADGKLVADLYKDGAGKISEAQPTAREGPQ
jgi:energy-coupling factor transporter ATP-binding protein EcfA2